MRDYFQQEFLSCFVVVVVCGLFLFFYWESLVPSIVKISLQCGFAVVSWVLGIIARVVLQAEEGKKGEWISLEWANHLKKVACLSSQGRWLSWVSTVCLFASQTREIHMSCLTSVPRGPGVQVIGNLVQIGFKQLGNLLAHMIKKGRGHMRPQAHVSVKVHCRLRTFLWSLPFHLSETPLPGWSLGIIVLSVSLCDSNPSAGWLYCL